MVKRNSLKMVIAGQTIWPGEQKQINAQLAMLPTRTEIAIPIIVHRAEEPGPCLLVMGGMHGDEINGVEIVRRILVKDLSKPQRGTIICIPIVNVYGFINSSREVPDGKDVNRSFPGNQKGSLASQVAYHITNDILPYVDVILDFHTGGGKIYNFPQIRAELHQQSNKELAKAFNAPFSINAPLRERSLRKEASKKEIPVLVFEGGESMRLNKTAIEQGLAGYQRVLLHLGMRQTAPASSQATTYIKESRWVRARQSGLYHNRVTNGAAVKKGEVLGLITDPFGEVEIRVKSPITGWVLATNNNPVVNRGDALVHVGEEGV